MPESRSPQPNTNQPPQETLPQNPNKAVPVMENGVLKFKAGMINVDDLVESQARDIASAKMTEGKAENEKNGFLKKNFNRIFKYNILAEFNRQKEYNIAKAQILNSRNLVAGEGNFNKTNIDLDTANKNATSEVISKFMSEYEDDMLTKSEKDSKHTTNNSVVTNQAKALIDQYAHGVISQADFTRMKNDLIKSNYGDKTLYAENLMEIAEAVKSSLEHNRGLERLDYDIDMTFGNARSRIKTQANYNKFDKAVAWLKNSKFATGTKLGSWLVSEPAVLAYAALVGGLTGASKAVASKAGNLALFGLGSAISGGFHAVKEGARVTEERAQIQRELAKGMTSPDSKRRKEFENSTYKMVKSTDILSELDQNIVNLSRAQSPEQKNAYANNLINMIADLDARKRLGEMKKVDLISYSNFANIEQEANAINTKIAEIKRALNLQDPANKEVYNRMSNDAEGRLVQGEGGLEQKNEAFKKMKYKKMGSALVKGTLVSAGIGAALSFVTDLGGQEIRAWNNPKFDGLTEKIAGHQGGNSFATPLEHLRRYLSGEHILDQSKVVDNVLANGMHIHTPEGVNIVPDGHGHYTIFDHGKVIADNVNLDNSGVPDTATMDMLGEKGILASEIKSVGNPPQIVNTTPDEYIKSHPDLFKHIDRTAWMDNNTPAPDFNQNELKLWWGGENNTGINANGDFVYNVSHMSPDGSFHQGLSANAMELAKQGKLEMMLAVSKDTDSFGIPVSINEHGEAIIPKDSEIAKLLFKNVNGHADFLGSTAEVHDMSHNYILATDVGEGLKNLQTTVPGDLTHHMSLGIPKETMSFMADPIPVPLIPRTPLERAYHTNNQAPYKDNMGFRQKESKADQSKEHINEKVKMDDGNMAPIEPEKWDDGMMAPLSPSVETPVDRTDDIRRITQEYNDELQKGKQAVSTALGYPNTNQDEHWYSIGEPGRKFGNGRNTRLLENPKSASVNPKMINETGIIPESRRLDQFTSPQSEQEYYANLNSRDGMEIDDSALHANQEFSEGSEAGELSPDTDYVLSYIGSNPTTLESKIERYIGSGNSAENPSFVIFESDPNKRDEFNSEIDRLEEEYPNIKFVYVPLPDDKASLDGKYLQDYMKEKLEEMYEKSGLGGVETKMTSGSTSKFSFENTVQEIPPVEPDQNLAQAEQAQIKNTEVSPEEEIAQLGQFLLKTQKINNNLYIGTDGTKYTRDEFDARMRRYAELQLAKNK